MMETLEKRAYTLQMSWHVYGIDRLSEVLDALAQSL
jgi:hypothetical protein